MTSISLRKRSFALPLAALALAVSSTYAAPMVGPADASFYTLPAPLPAGNHGDLLSYRQTSVKLGPDAPTTNAWNVLYQSTDSIDATNVVSGTVIVPSAPWSGTGARPVILYAVGTHGLAQGCAPSRQFELGTDYENANIAAALKAGYAVLVTDYQGYMTGDASTYLAGKSQGRAVLDIFTAATSIPGAGINADAQAAIWGYSQGGQSASWAAEVLSAYAPGIKVVGVAAGGIPADFIATSKLLNANLGFGFLASAIVGLEHQYPRSIPINIIASASGKAELEKIKTQCVFQALLEHENLDIASYTLNNASLDKLEGLNSVRAALIPQNLGTNPINVPMYQYHGQADEFIPLNQDIALKRAYCAKYPNVTFDVYPSEHIVTQFQAAPYVLTWLGDRFAGKAAPSTCSTTTAEPTSTANPGGGNFLVSLKNWPLTATVGLKTLKQTVVLPAGSTFSAETDITAKTLNGGLSVPDFRQSLKIIGISAQVGLKITPVGPTTGTASLDNDGQLHVHGKAYADITVSSILGIPFGTCKTASPVVFPLDFDGPISSLGNGKLTFTGTTAFPMIKGCVISTILSAFMSGSGQTYSFTVTPPAPVKY
jgi:Secretory lipase